MVVLVLGKCDLRAREIRYPEELSPHPLEELAPPKTEERCVKNHAVHRHMPQPTGQGAEGIDVPHVMLPRPMVECVEMMVYGRSDRRPDWMPIQDQHSEWARSCSRLHGTLIP